MRPFHERQDLRTAGNILLHSLLLVTLLTALATAHFAVVQKNSRQSVFLNELGTLRRYAETGVRLALHELAYRVGGEDGIIGTEGWTLVHDWGIDGRPGTFDEGEGDGIPSPGEPKVVPVSIGPPAEGRQLFVYSTDTAWAGVKHIVATAFDVNTYATVEVYARVTGVTMTSALYLEPGVALDLSGNAFRVQGGDTNPGGTPGTEPTLYGITTAVGDPPGSDAQAISVQIPTRNQDQIQGLGGTPSIGETGDVNFQAIFDMYKSAKTQEVTSGTYDSPTWGDWSRGDFQVTYCKGDLHLSGDGKGAGVLVVEGTLEMSGKFEFDGIVIVQGDVRMTGGGSGIHIYGGLMISDSLSAIDTTPGDLTITGNADINYSSATVAMAAGLVPKKTTILYWNDIK